jgi:hypothetical protein
MMRGFFLYISLARFFFLECILDIPPVVVPLLDAPVVPEVADGPPALELPPAVLLGVCASANGLDSANAVANAMVVSFIIQSSG